MSAGPVVTTYWDPQDEAIKSLAEAVAEMSRSVLALAEAVRSQPAPIVNVENRVDPTPVTVENRIDATPVTVENRVQPAAVMAPTVQNVRIVGLPALNARVRRDKQGRIDTITEG